MVGSSSADVDHARRMRCPAIEGIETWARALGAVREALVWVECVAPLLRGLKPVDRGRPARAGVGRMRCPAIEGIETRDRGRAVATPADESRMRCPAIEGIETSSPQPPRLVEPLLFGRMRCPAIEGIETR